MSAFIRPILYPKPGNPHPESGESFRTQEDISAMNVIVEEQNETDE